MLQGRPLSGKRCKILVEQGALLFDTRDPVDFRNGTIPGAVNLHMRQVSTLTKYPRDTKMVFFGSAPDDNTLQAVVNYVIQYGFTNVYILKSIDDWGK